MKNLKVLSKRGLSLLIAGVMCASMMPMQAFAAESIQDAENTVFIYINVEPEKVTVDENDDSAVPQFKFEGDRATITQTEESLSGKKQQIEAKAPVFDQNNEFTGAVENAQSSVDTKLSELTTVTKPVYEEKSSDSDTETGGGTEVKEVTPPVVTPPC